MARLSKRIVDAARPSGDDERYILWDDSLPGFGLLVLPTGVKSFIYNYRNSRGTKRRATIGKVGTGHREQYNGLRRHAVGFRGDAGQVQLDG